MLLKRKLVITFLICLEFLITILYTRLLGQNSEIVHIIAKIKGYLLFWGVFFVAFLLHLESCLK